MHVAVGQFLVEDNPHFLRALHSHQVTVVNFATTFFDEVLNVFPDVLILSDRVSLFMTHVRTTLDEAGLCDVPVLAGISEKRQSTVEMLIDAGFDGTVMISDSRHQLNQAIDEAVLRRQSVIRDEGACSSDPSRIIFRDEIDLQIVELVTIGRTDNEIANILCFAEHTIRNRLSRLMSRSSIANRTQLARVFQQEQSHELMRRIASRAVQGQTSL